MRKYANTVGILIPPTMPRKYSTPSGARWSRWSFAAIDDFLEEMLDCFGSDLTLKPSGEDHFTFRVPVVVSDGFIGTILGFGDKVEVLTPRSVRQKVIDALAPTIKQYGL